MDAEHYARLTDRERECLRLARDGRGSKLIALELGISPRTVDDHIERGKQKLGVNRRVQAALLLADYEASVTLRAQSPELPQQTEIAAGQVIDHGAVEQGDAAATELREERLAFAVASPETARGRWLHVSLPAQRKRGGHNDLTIHQRLEQVLKATWHSVAALGSVGAGLYGISLVVKALVHSS